MRTAGLFAGIGGFELGLARAGHETELLCEIDPAANTVLKHRFAKVRRFIDDVAKIEQLPRAIDLVVAGFPCINLSLAGEKEGIDGAQSSLVRHVFRILANTRVPNLVIENVLFMLHLNRGEGLLLILRSLERLRYRWAYRVVDALGFGRPQRRERVFIVASRELDPRQVLFADNFAAPPPTPRRTPPASGFYWTEGIRGIGWAPEAVPTLKGGSTIGIPSPPAIWVHGKGAFTPDIRDAERMQGFDVDWTKPAESVARAGHRWKLVGNAVSAMASEWLGRRLATPGTYVHQLDPPLATDRTLPIAGWSMGKGAMEAVAVTRWAARVERPPLMKWLKFAPRPLSFKATRGFLERSQRSSLRFEAGFLDDLRKHEAAMREPDDLGRRAAAS